MSDVPNNVVALRGRGTPSKFEIRHHTACVACALVLDAKTKTATCRVCGQRFDAFEALLYVARRHRFYEETRKGLRGDCDALKTERDELRREVANLRAVRRRAGRRTGSAAI